MALTPEVQATQAGGLAVIRQSSQTVRAVQGSAVAVYNIPAEEVHATAALAQIPYRRSSQEERVTAQRIMAVVRGRTSSPRLAAWGFTLDGHDFYVLKLGTNGKTLVYDLSTKEWSWWTTGDSNSLRSLTGMNWSGAGPIPQNYGSNVIVGDDSVGVLWVMDPLKDDDDSISDGPARPYPRVATAQLPVRGRTGVPVFSVFLTASLGAPTLSAGPVSLEYSDDQGHSYVTADIPQEVKVGDYTQGLAWMSLGQARAPGRIFRITDDGALARVDSLDVNEE
jgi:hypothetical protein